jgi:hypothetical protein
MRTRIFLLCQLAAERPVIRLCISGIDNGSAAYLEMDCIGSRKDAQLLVEKIASELKIQSFPDIYAE